MGYLRHSLGVRERFRRLGWRGLWLVAKHGLRAWLTAPVSTGAEMLRHDGVGWASDRRDGPVQHTVDREAAFGGSRSCSRGSS